VDKDELTNWALANGWQMIAGCPSLTKPGAPKEAIVRMVLKATVVSVEVKRPAGKWQKITSESYSKIKPDPETGLPRGLGFDTIAGFTQLMEDNKNRIVFAKLGQSPD
jgi:predicted component of type VI protein secretion system